MPPRIQPARTATLNEGRGANPGDTRPASGTDEYLHRAQRRPGREPRRHVGGHAPRPLREDLRSTKAGARTPATPAHPRPAATAAAPLNEGRGANPGDTGEERERLRHRLGALNEGRGANPGDTSPHTIQRGSIRCAQRRPGREPRRHRARAPPTSSPSTAQRRPGREPRRHLEVRPAHARGAGRSTKAGARTPATRTDRCRGGANRSTLNEGRGANPGDTLDTLPPRAHGPFRSTKAGARTPATRCNAQVLPAPADPAQRRPGREPRRHAERLGALPPASTTLNEGRGANPGDTRRTPRTEGRPARSTKAGARTPATRQGLRVRPSKSSARSTKAGARTPATRVASTSTPRSRAPALNEGRGANPGDTGPPDVEAQVARRRSTKAGARTPATRVPASIAKHRTTRAQRRPGREPRRHGRGRPRRAPGPTRSTKAGARTPATRSPASKPSAICSPAQRRPGREPRRHT